MKKHFLLTSVIVILLLSACKKPTTTPSVTITDTRDTLTYQPITANSKWTYKAYINNLLYQTYEVTCLDKDSTINNKVYRVYDSEVEGLQFNRRAAEKYYTVLTTSTNKTELLILDATQTIGASWVGGVNGTDTYTYTVEDILPSYQFGTFTFTNVYVINQVRTDNNNNVTLTAKTWHAQGIGIIKSEGTLSNIPVQSILDVVDIK